MTKLQIGGVRIDRQAALELARHYLSQRQGWAYPAYDGFDTARASGPLTLETPGWGRINR
jgi:hypothetical protein